MMTNAKDEASLAGSCLPTLPLGYVAQPAWGFLDPTGRLHYELHRVYAPPEDLPVRGEVAQLDEDASYWVVTWPMRSDTGDEYPAGRWVSYARARELLGARLSFGNFCSPSHMSHALPELLRGRDETRIQNQPNMGAREQYQPDKELNRFRRAPAHAE